MYNALLEKLKSGECLSVRLKRGNTYRFGENNSCIIKINANQMWGAFLNENSIILVRNNYCRLNLLQSAPYLDFIVESN